MKTRILLLVIICLPAFLWAQKESIVNNTVKDEPNQVTPPEYTGIVNATKLFSGSPLEDISDYLNKYVEYPKEAARCKKEGTAIVQFVVTAEGELTDFKVVNSVCPQIDQELIRAVKATNGMWKPGFKNEKSVDMKKEVAMMFIAGPVNHKNPKDYLLSLARKYTSKGNVQLLEKHNPKKALKHYNQSLKYIPYDASTLLMRGLCEYEMGDSTSAITDWEKIKKIGNYNANLWIENLAYLKGYNEMKIVLNK